MNQHDGWFEGIARKVVRYAARRAPPALSERLQEEWLADVTARSGTLSQLRFALGCCWATTVIAHEFGAPVPAAASASASKAIVHHAVPGPSFSRRTTVLLVIVGLHVLVISALATGIVVPSIFQVPPRIEVSFLPKPAPPIPPSPLDPKPTRLRPHIHAPQAPELPKEEPVTARNDLTTDVQPVQPVQPANPQPPPIPVKRILGGPGAGFPNTEDFYPQASRRLGERGIATINVCVDTTGRLIGQPTIDQSSGSPRLDEGAVKLANAGSGHYRSTTENGNPVSACYPFRIRFEFKN